jgi:DNA-binding PadR family transcriptional regulator
VRELTTTSYAILGLLALRPWSAYDLTKQAQRSLRFCWPRAETRLYQEPKNLVAQGLAEATVETVGKRSKTVYAITPKGRKALRAWLDQPSAAPRLESEALVRLFFAEHGTKEGLLATLDELERQATELRAQAIAQAEQYLEAESAPFPERLHILALLGQFMLAHTTLMAEWAAWARGEVETWPAVDSAPVSSGAVASFEKVLAEGPLRPGP